MGAWKPLITVIIMMIIIRIIVIIRMCYNGLNTRRRLHHGA